MRELKVDEVTRNAAALRARVRSQTGLIPDRINDVVSEMMSFPHALERTAAALAEALHLEKTPRWNPIADLRSTYVSMLPQARNLLISWIVRQYEVCLPNVVLGREDFVEMMDKTVGSEGFDAGLIEDMVCEMVPRGRQLALKQLLESARRLVPVNLQNNSKWRDKLFDGRKLLLAVEYRTRSWANGGERVLPEEDHRSMLSLAKLSLIMVCKADPAVVQTSICNPPSPLWLRSEQFPYSIAPEKPIRSITLFERGGLVVEYDTPMQARAIAEALLGERAPTI